MLLAWLHVIKTTTAKTTANFNKLLRWVMRRNKILTKNIRWQCGNGSNVSEASLDTLFLSSVHSIECVFFSLSFLFSSGSANLVFLLDCSRNVGLEVIQSYKVFVKEVCEHIGILPSGMNFGLLECGVVSRHQNGIKTYETVNDLDETLEGIVPGSGKCELGRAIQDVDQETFAALPNTAPKVLVIILAGQVGDDAANQALELKKQGVRIIALGIGPQVNMEKFGGIADSPLYAFKVPMFEYLLSMSSTVEGFVNHGKGNLIIGNLDTNDSSS